MSTSTRALNIEPVRGDGGNTSQGPSKRDMPLDDYHIANGSKGGDALMRKLGDTYVDHFSRLGKLSAEKKKARKAKSQLPPEWQAFVDMLNGTGSQVTEKDSAVDINMNTGA